ARQNGLEGGVLEGVAVILLDERLGVAPSELGDDPPVVAPFRKLLVGVLDPDDGDPFPARLLDKADDVRDDRVALVSPLECAVLHVDDEECGVRPVLECGHGLPLFTPGSCVHCPTRRFPTGVRHDVRYSRSETVGSTPKEDRWADGPESAGRLRPGSRSWC